MKNSDKKHQTSYKIIFINNKNATTASFFLKFILVNQRIQAS